MPTESPWSNQTASTIESGHSPLQQTGSSPATPYSRESVLDITSLTVANIKTANAVPGWATANDTNLTGSISGGTLTIARANAGGSDSRAGGSPPMFYTTGSSMNDELVARISNPATTDYCVAGLFLWDGGNESCSFAQWKTTLELHADPTISGVANIVTRTIVQSAYTWQMIRRIGGVATFYYSLSTAEPTEFSNSTADESTHWVRAGKVTTFLEAGATTWPRIGIWLSYPAGTLQQYTVSCSDLRYRQWN